MRVKVKNYRWLCSYENKGIMDYTINIVEMSRGNCSRWAEPRAEPLGRAMGSTRLFSFNVQKYRCFQGLYCHISSWFDTAIANNGGGLLQIWVGILVYGIDGLFTPLNLIFLCLTGVYQM
jgi:hypothetical protein